MAKRDNEEVIFASLKLDVSKRAAIKCFLNTEWHRKRRKGERTAMDGEPANGKGNLAFGLWRIPPHSPLPPPLIPPRHHNPPH